MSDPIKALRKIMSLCNPDKEIKYNEDLVCEIYTIADDCLSNHDLIDIDSDDPIVLSFH